MSKLLVSIERFIEKQGLSLFLTLLTGAIVIVITLISWFWPGIYQIVRNTHAFEAIVVLILIEVIVLLTRRSDEEGEFEVFTEESDTQVRILEIVRERRIDRAQIVSAGLASRRLLIGHLIRVGVKVQVLAQDPQTALSRRDAQRTYESIDWIRVDVGDERLSSLDTRFHSNVASLRAIILYEAHSSVKHLFLGWYTYYDENSRILGSQNPTIYVSTRSYPGRMLGEWAEHMIEKDLVEGRLVPLPLDLPPGSFEL